MKIISRPVISALVMMIFVGAGVFGASGPAYASGGPTITQQPTDQFSATGGTVEFVVAATATGDITIQWQHSTDNGNNWVDVLGDSAITNTLEVVASTSTAGLYKAVVTANGIAVNSSSVSLRVSASLLHTVAFTPERVESGRQSRSVLNGTILTTFNPVYVCFRWNINGVPGSVVPGSSSWASSLATYTNTTGVTEEWVFEIWTHRNSSGEPANSVPIQADCDRMILAYNPDVVGKTLFVYPNGALTPSNQSVTGTIGSAVDTGALTPNAGWPGALVFSVSPSLPAGLTLNPETGAITGIPTGELQTTPYTITAVTTENGQTIWDAVATINLTIEQGPVSGAASAPQGSVPPQLVATGLSTDVSALWSFSLLLMLAGLALLFTRKRNTISSQ